ncbi:MAG: hypothetical protein ACOVRB_10860 [Akkermansiaceae bacterium]|jgi:hypothetical protein
MKINSIRMIGPAILAGISLSSCAANKLNPGPISSKPPATAIVASSEFSIGDGFIMKKFIYPAGVYQPVHEDSKAHYYAPPGEQIQVKDTGMSLGTQGGIYWEKGLITPRKVYFTGNFGIKLPWDKPDMPISIKR